MASGVKLKNLSVGNPEYRAKDPSIKTIERTQQKLRDQIDELVYNEEIPFYDKLYALAATQRGDFIAYRQNEIVERLDKARKYGQYVLLSAAGKQLVGVLDEERPWDFTRVEEQAAWRGVHQPRADLLVRFAAARAIGDTIWWEHSSYGQSSTRHETAPSVEPVKALEVAVGLPFDPIGSENLYGKVENYSRSLMAGLSAIHEHIEAIRPGDENYRKRIALQAAVSLAVSQMGREHL